MKLSRWLVVPCLLIAGCGGPAPSGEGEKAAEAAPVAVETVTVGRKTLRTLLEVSGSFVVSQGNSARLTFGLPGRVAKVVVSEGDHVRKGQLLATIDAQVQQSQLSAARAGAIAARRQAEEAKLTFQASDADQKANVHLAEMAKETAKLERDGAVRQARFDYETAIADLHRLRSGARPQEISQAHQTMVQAQVTRDRAQSELSRDQDLAQEGYIARRQLEDAQAALSTAEAALASAQASESLVREGARPEEIRASELKAAAARQALSNATLIGNQRVRQAESVLRQAQQAELSVRAKATDAASLASTANQRTAEASTAGATNSQTEIRAPYDGTVTHRSANPGDFADTTTVVLEISGSAKRLDFLANVPAEDAAKVKVGMEAEIDTGSESKDSARVTNVSPADPVTGLSAVRMATASTSVAGTFAHAQIVLSRSPDAVAVPKEAIVDRDGKSVVFTVDGDTAKMTEVKLGAEDSGFDEAIGGVKPGEVLVKLGQFELADGAKIKAVETKDEKGSAQKDGGGKP